MTYSEYIGCDVGRPEGKEYGVSYWWDIDTIENDIVIYPKNDNIKIVGREQLLEYAKRIREEKLKRIIK